MSFNRISAVSFCVLLFSVSVLSALDIKLTAREFEGFTRRGENVTVGVNLPQRAVNDIAVLSLHDSSGKPIPAQFETTATWADGSVRWVLIDFSADCAPNGSVFFTLSDKPAKPGQESPLKVSRSDQVITVETGVMRCELDPVRFNLFGRVWLDHNGDGAFSDNELVTTGETPPAVSATDAAGRKLATGWGEVKSCEIEAQGPVRATVAVKGSLYEQGTITPGAAKVDYTARLHFYSGSGLVRVFFTLENHNPTHPLPDRDGDPSHWVSGREGAFFFEDMSLSTRLAFEGPVQLTVGDATEDVIDRMTVTGKGGVYQESSGGEHWFHRNHMDHTGKVPLTFRGAKFFLDGVDAYRRNRPDAWLHATDRQFGVAVAVRHFWQNFPKALTVNSNGTVRVGLWPAEFPGDHMLEGGEIKTHEIVFFFHTGPQGSSPDENRVATAMAAFHHPLYLRASASHHLAGGMFDDAATYDPGKFPKYEGLMHGALINTDNNLIADIEEIDEYGWRNFGDTWAKNEKDQTKGPHSRRIVLSHYNHEYDHGYGMILQSLRTASADPRLSYRWWNMALPALRHESDIDLYHTSAKFPRGGVHDGGKFTHTAHGVDAALVGHRGGPRLSWFGKLRWPWGEGSNPESGHFNNRGMMALYYLTGERRVLESAQEIRDLVYWKVTENRFSQIGQVNRDAGNNLQIITDAYLRTWDEKYRLAGEKILLTTHPDSQWYMTDAGRKANPEKNLTGLWSASICIDNVARFTETVEQATGKPYKPGRDYVIRYADFFATQLAAGPKVGFSNSWSPSKGAGSRGYGPWTYRIADIVMWGHKFTTDKALQRRCERAARDAFEYMRRQYPGSGPIYLDAKPNTMVTGGGHQYTAWKQKGGWK